jgi:hypothetical protein
VCAAPINDPEAKVRYADIRVIHVTTGEIIRALTLNPEHRYDGTGKPTGGITTFPLVDPMPFS